MAQANHINDFMWILRSHGYYRKFVKDYGKITAPLIDTLKKNNFMWSHKAENAFMELKRMMAQGSVLALPNFHQSLHYYM